MCGPGLVTLDEMKAKQDDVIKAREQQMATNQGAAHLDSDSDGRKRRKKRKHKQVNNKLITFVWTDNTNHLEAIILTATQYGYILRQWS